MKISVREVIYSEGGKGESISSFIVEDGVVYVNPIHGFSKDVVGSYTIDEDGDMTIELDRKPI